MLAPTDPHLGALSAVHVLLVDAVRPRVAAAKRSWRRVTLQARLNSALNLGRSIHAGTPGAIPLDVATGLEIVRETIVA